MKEAYPEKFVPEERVFSHIHPGDRIFIGTGCAEPQYLLQAFIRYIESHPKAFPDVEVFTLGVAPYSEERFKHNFRYSSFFVGPNIRDAINKGTADYTPIFLSAVPDLFYRRIIPVDVALIQTSPPDHHGFLNLGVSVDIVKAAIENSSLVVAQVNTFMPRVHGDGFIHINDIHYIIPHDEPILEFHDEADNEIAQRIGGYVSRLVQDGDTIQVGYGSIPNAILTHLDSKRHLGVHTELLSDGIVDLIKKGVIDNTRKSINRGKSVASFCMGKEETYHYIHDNPAIEFKTIDYTNNPLVIAQHENMVAINSALQIDLTGQSTAESIGKLFYSGIGGQADFMRGALLSRKGKTILALPSTAKNEAISRIVPFLNEGAGTTLNRGDVHYVVTEYGIAYLHGKNIRERAMELISIAHPKFQSWLIDEARKLDLIFKDQAFIPGKEGVYPEQFETSRTTKKGLNVFLRPVKISDEPLLKDLVYSLSEDSRYRRFVSSRREMPHDFLQNLVVIDYTKEMAILAVIPHEEKEEVIGVARYAILEDMHFAEIAFVVRDAYQNKGLGTELFSYLTFIAKKQGLLGFTALVLLENQPMLHLIRKMGFETEEKLDDGMYEIKMTFRKDGRSGTFRREAAR
ncbi:MAG: GNAT family N-acetyltransferase [Thermodesulfobacteriota bacterium]